MKNERDSYACPTPSEAGRQALKWVTLILGSTLGLLLIFILAAWAFLRWRGVMLLAILATLTGCLLDHGRPQGKRCAFTVDGTNWDKCYSGYDSTGADVLICPLQDTVGVCR